MELKGVKSLSKAKTLRRGLAVSAAPLWGGGVSLRWRGLGAEMGEVGVGEVGVVGRRGFVGESSIAKPQAVHPGKLGNCMGFGVLAGFAGLEECGGEAENLSVSEIKELLVKLFGQEILTDRQVVTPLKDGLDQLPNTIRQLSGNIKLVKRRQEEFGNSGQEFSLGVYATCHRTLKAALGILRRFCPPGVSFSFLPSHGSRAAVTSTTDRPIKSNTPPIR